MVRTLKLTAGAALALALPMPALAQGGSQPTTATQQPRTNQDSERRICRRDPVTGSLARRTRRCFTQAEWDRIAAAARENTQYEMDRNMSRPPGSPGDQ